MSIALSTLVSRLQTQVQTEGGVPTSDQYTQAIRDAVNDFNGQVTRTKSRMLSIVAGTATYELPVDFVKIISLKPVAARQGNHGQLILVTSSGLIPLSGPLKETITIEGTVLRITPTPVYTLQRELRYGAGYVESGSPAVYAEMTEREARIVLLYAKSIAYGDLGAAKVGTVTEYTVGDVRAKLGNAATDLQTTATSALAEYQAAVEKYIGTVAMQG